MMGSPAFKFDLYVFVTEISYFVKKWGYVFVNITIREEIVVGY
jgi:hypothetical protein